MAYEEKEGSGTLFQNDKGGNDKRPDWRGTIKLDGKIYEIAGWTKRGNRGDFLSLSGKVKEDRPASQRPSGKPPQQRPPVTRQSEPPADDEIPW